MIVYFALCVIAVIIGLSIRNESHKDVKLYVIIAFSIIAFFVMFRSSTVGGDTITYYRNFKMVAEKSTLSEALDNTRFEFGYVVLVFVLSRISSNPQSLLIVAGAFVCIAFARFIYQYSLATWFSVLMFLTLDFFNLCMSNIRLSIAVAFLLFAYDGLVKRRLLRTLVFVLLASTFHASCIFFLILYPISLSKPTARYYVISTMVGLYMFFFFERTISVISRFFPQYTHYLTESSAGYSNEVTLAVVLMLLLWVILYGITEIFKEPLKPVEETALVCVNKGKYLIENVREDRPRICEKYGEQLLDIGNITVWASILMMFLAMHGTILARFKLIFAAIGIIYYPNCIESISNEQNKTALLVGSTIVFIAYAMIIYIFRPNWQHIFPYKFFWQ